MSIFKWISSTLSLSIFLNFLITPLLAFSPSEIAQKVKPMTVQLMNNNHFQTGVILGQDQGKYWVLSCDLSSTPERILTVDNQVYAPISEEIITIDNSPLILIPFRTPRPYSTPILGNWEDLQEGDRLYVSGWINWGNSRSRLGQFQFTEGILSSLVTQENANIDFTYTNEVYEGMLGSPIFTQEGILIGIHCQNAENGNYPNGGLGLEIIQEMGENLGFTGGFQPFGSPPSTPLRDNQPLRRY